MHVLDTCSPTRWSAESGGSRGPRGGARDGAAQDGIYALVVRDGEREDVRIIGAVKTVRVARESPQAVVAALASADVHLVTLTITEKGYKLDPATGRLLDGDAGIAADQIGRAACRESVCQYV